MGTTNLAHPLRTMFGAGANDLAKDLEHESGWIRTLVASGGPQPAGYDTLSAWFTRVMARYREGRYPADALRPLWDWFGAAGQAATMQGFAARKPHGYHGDFEIIDRIYRRHVSTDGALANWDHYFHSRAGTEAVRNRKTYFLQRVDEWLATFGKPLRMLVVASGPGRDLYEALSSRDPAAILVDAIDRDPKAIAYARALCSALPNVRFHQSDVLRRLPPGPFDVIWCAGLFDYLSERLFVGLTRRLLRTLADDGVLVVGNFSPHDPSRDYMEFAHWNLIHRSPEDLLRLARRAGVEGPACRVDAEPLGVNLFLNILR